jgi:glycosyltransferase involved in cell wall biosynthesis
MDKQALRVIQFVDTYFPMVDGVVVTVHNYAALMNREGKASVIFPQQKKKPGVYAGLGYETVQVKRSGFSFSEYALPSPRLDRDLKRYLDGFHADLFHIHSPFFLGAFAAAYARKHHIPCVATFHSKYYDDALNITDSKFIARMATKFIVRFYQRADSVWACSRGTAETLRSYGYRGEIFVMDNGSSFRIGEGEREALAARAAAEYGLEKGKKTILFVGHLIWHKNLRLVLDTMKRLAETGEDCRLLIAGDGYDGKAIRKYADSLELPESMVRFLGRIDDRDLLAGVILFSDLFFFPSVYDNSPLVLREAASLGLPALLTAGSNAAEVITKDVNGFTAEESPEAMSAEIRRIFGDEALRRAAGKSAETTVAKSWEQIVAEVEEKYRQVIAEYREKHGGGVNGSA